MPKGITVKNKDRQENFKRLKKLILEQAKSIGEVDNEEEQRECVAR